MNGIISSLNWDLIPELELEHESNVQNNNNRTSTIYDESFEKNNLLILEVEELIASISEGINNDSLFDSDSVDLSLFDSSNFFCKNSITENVKNCHSTLIQEKKRTGCSTSMIQNFDYKLKHKLEPYPRDKIERKRAQNRNAASKYREKKKAENDAVDIELLSLQQRNSELKKQLHNLEIEMKCLKQLMEETGIIKVFV